MNSLSREKRVVHNLYKDYLSTEDLIPFIQSNKYRCNFSDTVYPAFKKDMCKFFQGKDYWPETHIKNPKSEKKYLWDIVIREINNEKNYHNSIFAIYNKF